MRKAPKRHFLAPSLAVAALGHLRDEAGVEADAIITLDDGRWAACEITLAESPVDEGAASLLRFASKVDTSKVDTSKTGEPGALIVVTAGAYAYRRDDGVSVVPLSALAPDRRPDPRGTCAVGGRGLRGHAAELAK